jgi:dephospho-CoA kinase
MIIGITGSIGSGKTTAAKIFSRHWYSRIDADGIGHAVLDKNSQVRKKIIKEFGSNILGKNKNISREKLGDIVFNDGKKLNLLNSIMHPAIIKEIKNKIKKIKQKCGDKARIVVDAPLLLETKTKDFADRIIVVKCDNGNIIKRLNKKYPKDKIERILNSQMPLDEKLKHADFIIDNNRDLVHLENQVKKIIKKLE